MTKGMEVKVVEEKKGIPEGWRMADLQEAEDHRELILSQMGDWFIVEVAGGKISGRGYGGRVEACEPGNFGQLVVVKNSHQVVRNPLRYQKPVKGYLF